MAEAKSSINYYFYDHCILRGILIAGQINAGDYIVKCIEKHDWEQFVALKTIIEAAWPEHDFFPKKVSYFDKDESGRITVFSKPLSKQTFNEIEHAEFECG